MVSFLPVAGQPYTPPSHVIRRMRAFNPRLRLRWSHQLEAWVVEIKANRALYTGDVSPEAHYAVRTDGAVVERDAWIRWRDGYWLLGEWQAQPMLGDWCVHNLQRYAFDRLGGAKGVERLLDAIEERERRSRESLHADELNTLSHDLYSTMAWKGGTRAAVPRKADGLGVY
jgi:hypothetical protein